MLRFRQAAQRAIFRPYSALFPSGLATYRLNGKTRLNRKTGKNKNDKGGVIPSPLYCLAVIAALLFAPAKYSHVVAAGAVYVVRLLLRGRLPHKRLGIGFLVLFAVPVFKAIGPG